MSEINLDLHPKQEVAAKSSANEILYGGAAGGGKSHLMRCIAIIFCSMLPGLQVYIFRRISSDLTKNHMEGVKGFRALLSPWTNAGFCKIVDDQIRFWNGSKIYMCHCEHEKNKYKYDGAEIHLLLMDELTHFTESIYRFLRGRVRAVGLPELTPEFKSMFPGVTFPRILCGTNPGNVGHLWVKSSFIDNCQPLEIREMPDEEGGMLRQYIPALLEDNPSMLKDDPDYKKRLAGLGSEALVKAKMQGIWDIIEGAYFDCWSKRNIISPFPIPKNWTKFRSFDWGSAKPFSVGWYTVSPGYETPYGVWLPKDSIIKYREWYGCKKNEVDVGLKMTAEEVGRGILERDMGEEISYSVADPAIFTEDGGKSIAQRMDGVYFRKADNSRIPGWDQMTGRLKGMDGFPMLYFFSTCYASIRTIPALQHDERRPEDLNTKMEDHAADECRYACMSNPWTRPTEPDKVEPKDGYRSVIEDIEVREWRTV